MDWKPSVCWQVPIRLEHSTDESGHLTSRLREWKRRDWGEGGADFGGGAPNRPTRSSARSRSTVSAKDDIVELVGERGLRADGRVVGTTGVGAGTPPGAASTRDGRARTSVVVGLVVVVEGDAVLLRERGVLVILGLHWY